MFKDQALIVMGKISLILFPSGIAIGYVTFTYIIPTLNKLANVLQVK